jgi:prepilin-type N-terminal cleavage/methylation domain-containing protein
MRTKTIARKSEKGMSLVEVMVAVLISAIVMLGGSYFFVASTSQINLREQYRAASRLASQKLEELKAEDYDDVTDGEVTDSVKLENSSYSRKVVTKDLGSYKQVTVNVTWGDKGNNNVTLETFIAPK